jgi:hypothetical protein
VSSATALRAALLVLLCAIVLAAAGTYEWSVTGTCGSRSGPNCQPGSHPHLHPKRAKVLWGAGVVVAIIGAGLIVRARSSSGRD